MNRDARQRLLLDRRVFLCSLASSVLAAGSWSGASQETGRDLLPQNLEPAIERGLTFLQKQQRLPGSFDAAGPASAITGLSLLAFLGAGHIPEVGKYGNVVRLATNHLLGVDPDGGFLGKDVKGNERMYAHCVGTIALAQVHGLEAEERQRRRVHTALEKALSVLFAGQDVKKDAGADGGWRYGPTHAESDLSVTAWGVLALAACADAGLAVPRERLDRALSYVVRCYRSRDRGFAYQPTDAASASMTGAGLLCLHLLGAGNRPEVAPAVEYLLEKPIRPNQRSYHESLYFTTQAAYQVGGRAWGALWKNASEQLLPGQNRDGSWNPRQGEPSGEGEKGRVYSTAMAVMILSIPLRLLPVFQRPG